MSDRPPFEELMASLDTPSYLVTTSARGERAGCLVGFASQCSIDPPRFAVWLSKLNHTYRVACDARTLVVHALRSSDVEVARWFAVTTGDDVDKFSAVEWAVGPDGCPVLEGLDWFAGSIVQRVDAGDHVAFLLDPGAGRTAGDDEPQLTGDELGDVEAGHPPDER